MPSWEWVKIYNAGSETVDLAGFVFGDNNGLSHASANIAGGAWLPGNNSDSIYLTDLSADPSDGESWALSVEGTS